MALFEGGSRCQTKIYLLSTRPHLRQVEDIFGLNIEVKNVVRVESLERANDLVVASTYIGGKGRKASREEGKGKEGKGRKVGRKGRKEGK
jgi:hypothetical protein